VNIATDLHDRIDRSRRVLAIPQSPKARHQDRGNKYFCRDDLVTSCASRCGATWPAATTGRGPPLPGRSTRTWNYSSSCSQRASTDQGGWKSRVSRRWIEGATWV